MTDQNQSSHLESSSTPAQETPEAILAGQPTKFYLNLVIKPVALALAALIVAEFSHVAEYFDWIVLLGAALYIGWRVASHKSTEAIQSIIAGAFGGALLGLTLALFRFIVHLKVYHFFEIVTEPITFAVLGMLLAGSVYWMISGRSKISKELPKK